MKLLVFQHSAGEPPAAFGAHAEAAGDQVDIVRLFDGEAVPACAEYDALMVMGGPMDVWEEDAHPWLRREKSAIRAWVLSGRPYLGICLGHQLLAEAMGGTCALMPKPEIAVSDVTLSVSADDPIVGALPRRFAAMHWHGVEVTRPPQGAQVLGYSEGCANQMMRIGSKAWGLQFHPEVQRGTVTQWMQDPGNLACAVDWLGSEAAAWAFVERSEAQADDFVERSARLYSAFRAQV
ncbi:type 1 glutamine amidotransferase [Primorskyibacter sp. S187A]|uniref:type 1 glutamine amidotransferase n=1 Tax=Primorskyibacter sp. S187A TaxID=3415130 RepID=UPI003C7ACBBA